MIKKVLSYPGFLLGKLIKTKLFETVSSNPLLATLTLVMLVVFWSFPSYDVAYVTHEMDANWAAIFLQAREPFTDHSNLYSIYNHASKLAFRFVPALFLNILHIKTVTQALIFQFFTLILFYYLLITLFNKLFKDHVKAFVYALPICFVMAGHVYTIDYKGVFDTLALDFLLLSFLLRKKVYVVIPLLLAYFCDERALTAAPAFFLANICEENTYENLKSILNGFKLPSNVYLFSSWAVYFMMRFYLAFRFGLKIKSGGTSLFFEQINQTFHTIAVGLEGFLIPFAFIVRDLYRKKVFVFSALLIFSFFIVVYIAQSVIDTSRSMSYVILILILILVLMDRLYSRETSFEIIALVTVINILYLDCYPLLAQLYRMRFITHSI